MDDRKKLSAIYNTLLNSYGYQGWWPLCFSSIKKEERSFFKNGYHPKNYEFPKTSAQRLEICLGAILTQNTKWQNVVSALEELKKSGLFSLAAIQKSNSDEIALAIKKSGYYNQKAQTIKRLVQFLGKHSFYNLQQLKLNDVRESLLSIKGIGPETADCILLYALERPSFVIDAYTIRICERLGVMFGKMGYDALKRLFENSLDENLHVFQEYHALLVHHGKLYYSRKPYGVHDRLLVF